MLSNKLNQQQSIHFSLGSVFALSFVFIAFEWQNMEPHNAAIYADKSVGFFDEQMIPITYPEKKTVQIPLPPNRAIFDRLDIRDDVPEEFEDNLEIIDEVDYASPEKESPSVNMFPGEGDEQPEETLDEIWINFIFCRKGPHA